MLGHHSNGFDAGRHYLFKDFSIGDQIIHVDVNDGAE